MAFGATFLVHPDLFPARRSGEPWGDRRIALALPGGPYRFAGLSPAQEEAVRERFGESCLDVEDAEGPPAAVESRVFAAAATDFLPVDTRGWEYACDLDFSPGSVALAGLGTMARLDWVPGLAGALWTPEDGGERFPGVFENYCRLLVAYRLLEAGGALLHSAGVVDGGSALVFFGPSGAGKTTLSRLALAAGREVLSDDLNAVFPAVAGARVEKLPFTGDVGDRRGRSSSHPLRAVLRLEKGADAGLRPLRPAATVAALLACAPFVNTDPHRRERLLANLQALAGAVPAYVLTFALAGGFWGMLAEIGNREDIV